MPKSVENKPFCDENRLGWRMITYLKNEKFREPQRLPKTIPFHIVQIFISTIYKQRDIKSTNFHQKTLLRDIAVIKLLFATGIRISELCALRPSDIDFSTCSVLIYGKGSKERIIQIGNTEVVHALTNYKEAFEKEYCLLATFSLIG